MSKNETAVNNPIRVARQKQGWSQVKLAERAGISKYTVIRLEAGKNVPRRSTVMVLAIALGITPAELQPRR